uniref:Uncharacterized protein n=1 Tax=Anguilla anguilla TaxID=7936 RepID=A0A0E9S4A1_ANGAN
MSSFNEASLIRVALQFQFCLARALIIILMSVLINDMGQQLKGGVWSLFGFSGTEMMAILKCRGIVFNCLKTYSDKVG